jgi:hypothetical protein
VTLDPGHEACRLLAAGNPAVGDWPGSDPAYEPVKVLEKTMKNQTPQSSQEPAKKPKGDGTKTIPDKTRGLDFSKLDLTVERVDERLSPSETNIFDK